jgi:O-methyltransferase
VDTSRLKETFKRVTRGARPTDEQTEADTFLLKATTTDADWSIIQQGRQRSMTSLERLQTLVDSVRYVVDKDLPGALMECGVWLGGSVLTMVLTLQDMGVTDRDVYLFDTFEGMTEPTEHDGSRFHEHALDTWKAAQETGETAWPYWFGEQTFTEQRVRELVLGTGYPEERVHFVRGRVEETIPDHAPQELALLRLDTDWYESTQHELLHLYPRLAREGVLIIDDYGHWDGARRAVDEYFTEHGPVMLTRIDYSGRLVIKT